MGHQTAAHAQTVTCADETSQALALVAQAREITAGVTHQAHLQAGLEYALATCCQHKGIPWLPRNVGGSPTSSETVHGAVLLAYALPESFREGVGAALQRARKQAAADAQLLASAEGRPLPDYILVAWDGGQITFGRYREALPVWEPLIPFDVAAATRLLTSLRTDGAALLSPQLLVELAGPAAPSAAALIPHFFAAIRAAGAKSPQTTRLFSAWQRFSGQVAGLPSTKLKALSGEQKRGYHDLYAEDPPAYLFALHTYIALLAKLVAALALGSAARQMGACAVPLQERVQALETGRLFEAAGLSQLLAGDFFSWYARDARRDDFWPGIERLIQLLQAVDFRAAKKAPGASRDLFKGVYQAFVPGALRHAPGSYYTPDWLTAHALDTLAWTPEQDLLDPTCGSGTFLLEGLRRRLAALDEGMQPGAGELLRGLYGCDLNPLAVLTTKASLVVCLARFLDPHHPVRLPVYLADALQTARREHGLYRCDLQTGQGVRSVAVPARLLEYSNAFASIQAMIEAESEPATICATLQERYGWTFSPQELRGIEQTIETLVALYREDGESMWCSILAERCAAGAIPPVQVICGNPPWIKWSNLPPAYSAFLKPRCLELGVFSEDRWVGGIESDLSSILTYEVIDKWLADQGTLGFFLPGTTFETEAGAGFRRFVLNAWLPLGVELVEDFEDLRPFEDANNHPTFLVVTKNQATTYPVVYRCWKAQGSRHLRSAEEFRLHARAVDLLASPMPGKAGGPWLKGTREEHLVWQQLFTPAAHHYSARKGVTTDLNGVFWVQVQEVSPDGKTCRIQNMPALGRKPEIPVISQVVETDHLFPLLRGKGLAAFCARPVQDLRILLPQRSMHGDPNLPLTHPRTWSFLAQFQAYLAGRSSLKRFQRNRPYWSLWSTGAYTFAPYKVLWKEIASQRFAAAYIGGWDDPLLGPKVVIPDHKLYFVPVETEEEAAYITGMLNAPLVGHAIGAYASRFSLGVSVVEYLSIPHLDSAQPDHAQMVALSTRLTQKGGASDADYRDLDRLATRILGVPCRESTNTMT